jgi:hypothetical protein
MLVLAEVAALLMRGILFHQLMPILVVGVVVAVEEMLAIPELLVMLGALLHQLLIMVYQSTPVALTRFALHPEVGKSTLLGTRNEKRNQK